MVNGLRPRLSGRWAACTVVVCGVLWMCGSWFEPSPACAASRQEAEDTAHLLAALLDAGRVVVDNNQVLIDDPHKGFKGFTPDEFERQVMEEFLASTRVNLADLDAGGSWRRVPPLARELLPALLKASKQVVADAQIVINQRGIGFKNFIPATFGSQAARRFSTQTHVGLKQTTIKPRNPKNEPDAYETEVLMRFAAHPGPASTISELVEGGTILRFFNPIYYDQPCLKCHGEPAGEEDIAGYPKEGGRLGELAGAISVTIPLEARQP